ncbi:MAG: non-canonical purine NTP pyrophosphatase [Planctomycetota bacterium]
MAKPPLVIGTHNAKKGVELRELLAPFGFEVCTLADFPEATEVVEDGTTFAENARLKAQQQAKRLGEWVLADDSGIEVDALDGGPGVVSARFAVLAGVVDQPNDQANNRLLLEKLDGLPPTKRGAGYYCHVTLADPAGDIRAESVGRCRGRIVTEPRGAGGFGFDPLFEVREYHQTFGELGPEVKRCLSHRGRAMRAIVPAICRELGAANA